jgi:Reverse transcriptase (RNA-dependent DNA polymerase)
MDEAHFKRAIFHLADLGDTDILPPLFEFQFFKEAAEPVVKKLKAFSAGSYNPVGAFEVLSPKTQTSFRIAHQLHATDTLLFTAAAIEIAKAVDALRLDPEQGAFAYRFDDDSDSSSLFTDECTYHDWLVSVSSMCEPNEAFSNDPLVLETDISDFYGRIYFHRIEHVLDDVEAANAPRRIIENVIKNSRARQSYGLPVGGAASRIIAEGVLIDVDTMLRREGLKFTRFVDDFRIIVDSPAKAHAALCRLAEYLMLTEGLSLNAAKTRIVAASVVRTEIDDSFSEIFTKEERNGLDRYLRSIYDSEDVAETIADEIDQITLIEKLDKTIKSEKIDYTAVKLILRALRVSALENTGAFVSQFSQLLYFAPRDFCILIGAQAQISPDTADVIAGKLLEIMQASPFKDMTLLRIWVSHLFVSGALPITDGRMAQFNFGDNPIEKRQAILLRARLKDRAFFREAKTRFGDLSEWEKPALMLGASCLAASEYDTWLGFCKGKSSDLLADEYIGWLKANRSTLIEKLDQSFVIKSRMQRLTEVFSNIDISTLLSGNFKDDEVAPF